MSQNKIQASANSDHIEYGTANIHAYTPQMLLAKSIKKLLMFWGAAVLSILLPVVHFVLVPLFFILGIVFAILARKDRFEITDGKVACPNCKKEITVEKAAFAEYHSEICQHCACVVRISPVA
jgi:hypothetical protein